MTHFRDKFGALRICALQTTAPENAFALRCRSDNDKPQTKCSEYLLNKISNLNVSAEVASNFFRRLNRMMF